MQPKTRTFLVILTIFTALLASLVGPSVVYADDEPPPESPGTEVTTSDTPENLAAEDVSETTTVEEIMEQVSDTPVIVLNAEGEVEPLATQTASEIIVNGDPQWCPATSSPGAAECTSSFTTFADLIAALAADAEALTPQYIGDGVIWVEHTYDGNDDSQIAFDGSVLTNIGSNTLIVRGGWNGIANETTIIGTSRSDVSMIFKNWSGNIFIEDFEINAADAVGFGLYVQTTGDITLDTVWVENTPPVLYGLGDGAILQSGGNVNISDSNFNDNTGNGLQVEAVGNITINTVSVSGNTLTGAFLDNCIYDITTGLCAGNGVVSITSASQNSFNDNGFVGLVIDAGGGVLLEQVQANNNGLTGANVISADNNGTGDIVISQSQFNGNTNGPGLDVISDGNITLNQVDAFSNRWGAVLTMIESGTGSIDISNSDFGTTDANGNTWTGLHAESKANISLANVIASYNNTNGAYLEAQGNISVSNSQFNDNVQFNFPTDPGLYAHSNGGNVTLVNVIADGNQFGAGAVLTTSQNGQVHVTGGHFNGNGSFGVEAKAQYGDITLLNMNADLNRSKGAYLLSHGSGNIFITNSVFVENGLYGIYAVTGSGNIILDQVTVSGDNGNDDGTPGNDDLTNIGAFLKAASGNVFVNEGLFEDNTKTGILAVAGGQVDLTNVTADQNGGNGVEVYSAYTYGCKYPGTLPSSIAVNVDGGSFINNDGYGLMVRPGPNGALVFTTPSIFGGNGLGDYLLDLAYEPANCEEKTQEPPSPSKSPIIANLPFSGGVPVKQQCDLFSHTILQLPNGTWVKVGCPFEGYSLLEGLLENQMPGALGAGVQFVDGIRLDLTDENGNIILNEDGTVTITFQLPKDARARSYSVLFWDPELNGGAGGWIKLPLYEEGTSFPLHPDNPDDSRLISSGVQVSESTVTFTVNFSGVFILVTP